LVGLGPHPNADAGCLAAGASASLICGGLACVDSAKPAHASADIVFGASTPTAVDNDSDSVDRHARLGDRGGENDLPTAVWIDDQREVLVAWWKGTVELPNHHAGWESRTQRALGSVDIACSRKEDKNVTFMAAQCFEHRVGDIVLGAPARCRCPVPGFDRMKWGVDLDDGVCAESMGESGGVERRRHDDDPEVFAENRGCLADKRQSGVGMDASLVELVEENSAHADESWVVEKHSGQDSLGDDFQAGLGTNPRVEPSSKSHNLPDVAAHL